MNTTPDELNKSDSFFENQRLSRELASKEEMYRKEIANGSFSLTINWQDNINDIDKDYLFQSLNLKGFDDFEALYTVEYLDLARIVNYHCKNEHKANKTYPTDKLFDTVRNDRKITKLVSYIKEGNTICPPVIGFEFVELTKNEVFVLYDGNHRIGLSRYLKLNEIPFIIRKSELRRLKAL